ncbi:TolC family outer membrane protein [Pseudomonas sp. NMS19W]|uniref:TolC family outer membrane protein n=1 Tax=Pseudomonas sp. NMS19W TaxID=3079768 RepID=UPI003F65A3AC
MSRWLLFLVLASLELQLLAVACADDLVSIYQEALRNDLQFSAAQAEHQAGLETVIQARAGLLPELSVQAQSVWSRNEYQFEGGAVEQRRQNQTYSVQLVQPVFRWKNWLLYQQGSQQSALAASRFYGAQQSLLLRVAQAYFQLLSAEEGMQALLQQQLADTRLLASALKQFELGNVSIADVHEARASADSSVAVAIKARSDVELARQGLAHIIGRQPPSLPGLRERVHLEPPFPADINEWVVAALQNSFEVQAQALLLEIARNEVRSRKADHLPTVDLVATQSMQQRPTVGAERSDLSSIGLRLSLPLYAGGRTNSAVREAQALSAKLEAHYEESKRTAQMQVHEAWLGVHSGMAQVRALEAAKISVGSALEANQLGYKVGVRISIDVLEAQSRFTETVRQLSRARYDTLLAKLRLKAAIGGLTEVDLQEVNRLLVSN